MDVSPNDIKLILDTLQDSAFDQAEVVIGDVRIAVARNGLQIGASAEAGQAPARTEIVPAPSVRGAGEAPAASAQPVQTEAVATAAATSGNAHVVESPSVGVFWRASSPGATPFVEIGQTVAAGDTVGIVEVMKLMTNIPAGVGGVVTAIHADNAGSVEFGTALVTIEPKA